VRRIPPITGRRIAAVRRVRGPGSPLPSEGRVPRSLSGSRLSSGSHPQRGSCEGLAESPYEVLLKF